MNSKTDAAEHSAATDCSPRIPTVGEYVRMFGTLVEVQDVTPPVVPTKDYIFEDTSARLEARINGKVVKEYGTYNNFYGKDRCVEAAIDEARKQQDWLGESNLEFVVVKVTERCRMRPTNSEHFYAREFREFKALDHGCKWDLPEETEDDVWSSSRGHLE